MVPKLLGIIGKCSRDRDKLICRAVGFLHYLHVTCHNVALMGPHDTSYLVNERLATKSYEQMMCRPFRSSLMHSPSRPLPSEFSPVAMATPINHEQLVPQYLTEGQRRPLSPAHVVSFQIMICLLVRSGPIITLESPRASGLLASGTSRISVSSLMFN